MSNSDNKKDVDFFKPEDFSRDGVDAFNWQEKSAELANRKLNAEIKKIKEGLR